MPDITKALIVHSLPYSDHSLVVHAYTSVFGMTSYMVKGIKGGKSRFKRSMFLPLTELEIISRHRSDGKLNLIREAKIISRYQKLHTDIIKQSLALFISEILHLSLREERENQPLYDFLISSIQLLDNIEEGLASYHLLFLKELTRYLGIFPGEPRNTPYFDMMEGRYINTPISPYWIEGKELSLFKALLGTEFEAFYTLRISPDERRKLLDTLLYYYRLQHLMFPDYCLGKINYLKQYALTSPDLLLNYFENTIGLNLDCLKRLD
jgi:DNA repair protein RecO (recombination protein O)